MTEPQLNWVKHVPLPWQRRCIVDARGLLPTLPGVQAVWLAGSLARGDGDRFSDVDLQCLIASDALPYWRTHWSDVVARLIGRLTLARTINDSIVGGFCLNSDWHHVDLILHTQGQFSCPVHYRTLHDPDGFLHNASDSVTLDQEMTVGDMSEFVFYLFGSLATLIGRNELILAQNSVLTLRQWLIRLMFLENNRSPVGGGRRLNKFLSADQRRLVQEAGAALHSMRDIQVATARLFDEFATRAQQLAVQDGSEFPVVMRDLAEHRLRLTVGADWRNLPGA